MILWIMTKLSDNDKIIIIIIQQYVYLKAKVVLLRILY